MADISRRVPGDDCEGAGERGERGKRGHRGHRGHDGHDGATGPTGPTGSTAAAVGLAYVYRPGATGADAPGGNVFTDWTLLMAAIDATRKLGVRTLEFDNSFQDPCPIPAGVWNMTDVKWINIPREGTVNVELLDGASIVLDETDPTSLGGNPIALQLEGYGLLISCNRTDPNGVAPFVGVDFLAGGNFVGFTNTNPAALPMFEVGASGFNLGLFSGEVANGGFGNPFGGGGPAAPLVELNGGVYLVFLGAGTVENNVFTDATGLGIAIIEGGGHDESRSDPFDAWAPAVVNPAFVLQSDVNAQVRYGINPNFALPNGFTPATPGAVVTPANSPYAASYNEFVKVDTSVGPVTVNLPNADRAAGDRVTVKDASVVTGTGDSFTVALGVVTLTDAAGLFTAAMVGKPIVIAGSTTPANAGTFVIASFIDPSNITYANPAGVTEAFPGTWTVLGNAATNSITIGTAFGNFIEAPVISNNGGSKTWISDRQGNWWLAAQV